MKYIKLKNPEGYIRYASGLSKEFLKNVKIVVEAMKARELCGMKTIIHKHPEHKNWYSSDLIIKNQVIFSENTKGISKERCDTWWIDSLELKNFFDVFYDNPTSVSIDKTEVESYISTVNYFTAAQGIDSSVPIYGSNDVIEKHNRFLFCMITLKNGMVFYGTNSGGMDPDKYDREFAENDAYQEAFNKVWEAVAIHKNF